MRGLALAGVVSVACTACGDAEINDTTAARTVRSVDRPCTPCAPNTPDDGFEQPPIAGVYAFPQRVMFYGDISEPGGLAPQVVTVQNSTPSAVLVVDAFIVDEQGVTSGGSQFFSVIFPNDDEPLDEGEALEMSVSFVRSSEQKFATLIILTTHPDYNNLTVQLTGKYFLW